MQPRGASSAWHTVCLSLHEPNHQLPKPITIVLLHQARTALGIVRFAQQMAAFVDEIGRIRSVKFRMGLHAKHLVVHTKCGYRAKRMAGHQASAWGQFEHLILMAGQQCHGGATHSIPCVIHDARAPTLGSPSNGRSQAQRNELMAETHTHQFFALCQQRLNFTAKPDHPGLV
jgi:hypothetical protein